MSSGFAPNYAWTGAPTVYNGTGFSGGDSGMFCLTLLYLPLLNPDPVLATHPKTNNNQSIQFSFFFPFLFLLTWDLNHYSHRKFKPVVLLR
jgi:hypothetical protein